MVASQVTPFKPTWRRPLALAERLLLLHTLLCAAQVLLREGPRGLLSALVRRLRTLPGLTQLVSWVLDREVGGAVRLLSYGGGSASQANGTQDSQIAIRIPTRGTKADELLRKMKMAADAEKVCDQGRAFAYSYFTDTSGGVEALREHAEAMASAYAMQREHSGAEPVVPGHEAMLTETYRMFMHGNALNPTAFPALRKFENEAVAMTGAMLHAPDGAAGSITSGGTESILLAVLAYREYARKRWPSIERPKVLASITVHPAFEKAAHWFDMEIVHAQMLQDGTVDVEDMKRRITRDTVLLVGSAPQYPHCVVDPIEALGRLAQERGLPLHVDACYGGFMLPWLEKLGDQVPLWDFRVPGVTSMSADIHKYGYAPKGASILIFRDKELRMCQYFSYVGWPGGLYGSPSLSGTRPGGNIACAWATMNALGEEGYLAIAAKVRDAANEMKAAVRATPGLRLVADTPMTGFAVCADETDPDAPNIFAVADQMETKGWRMERQTNPDSIHCSVMPMHVASAKAFAEDVLAAAAAVRADRNLGNTGTAAMLRMVGSIPDKTIVEDFVKKFFAQLYTA